jgi:hypothetical protein
MKKNAKSVRFDRFIRTARLSLCGAAIVTTLAFCSAASAATTPTVIEASVTGVTATEATLTAQVDPGEGLASYQVEYGPGPSYGLAVAGSSPLAGSEPAAVQIRLTGLQPASSYHARISASNEAGTAHGNDLTFTTPSSYQASQGVGLPDNRAYELVSTNASSDANVFIQTPDSRIEDLSAAGPARSTPDGDGVAYVGEALATGGAGSTGNGFGDQYIARRTASGWEAVDIQAPRGQARQYHGISADLSVGVLGLGAFYDKPPLTLDAPPNCSALFEHTAVDDAFHALFTSPQTPGNCGSPELAGISEDDAHIIFSSEAPLTPDAPEEAYDSLYESVNGHTYLVSIRPNGTPATSAAFGGIVGATADLEHVISPDGSSVVWTDLNTEPRSEDPSGTTRLFVREHADSATATTVQVDAAVGGGGQYQGASADDALIYFTKAGHLYQFDLESATTKDLTPAGGVVGVAGVSADGAEVYLVATTVLATNENSYGESAVAGNCEYESTGSELETETRARAEAQLPDSACNLYALHVGAAPRFVAVLLATDDNETGPVEKSYGDWAGDPTQRTSEVSSDGLTLAFMSTRRLTGYESNYRREVYVYDATTERLGCASCNPTGEPPGSGSTRDEGKLIGESYPPIPEAAPGYQYRWVSANGSRVFFDSTAALLPGTAKGITAVYEWERFGEGSCKLSGGCVYLISGQGVTNAYFTDASENGSDVFFTSRTDLLPEDSGENTVLYDARVDGGFARVAQACTGTGCQGVPPAAPLFATPPSATFSGVGNYLPQLPKQKPPAKRRTKHPRQALKACRRAKRHRAHARCEHGARHANRATQSVRSAHAAQTERSLP